MNNITENDLRHCYFETANLSLFMERLGCKNTRIKLSELNQIFGSHSPLWVQKHSGGHRKFVHKISKTVIEYQGHTSGSDNVINPGIQSQIQKQFQKHINFLGNEVFGFVRRGWREEPNYRQSLQRLQGIAGARRSH